MTLGYTPKGKRIGLGIQVLPRDLVKGASMDCDKICGYSLEIDGRSHYPGNLCRWRSQ